MTKIQSLLLILHLFHDVSVGFITKSLGITYIYLYCDRDMIMSLQKAIVVGDSKTFTRYLYEKKAATGKPIINFPTSLFL